MTSEEILRSALAFLLSWRNGDPAARAIAFKALKEAYGDEILGNSVEEHDQLSDQIFERNWKQVMEKLNENHQNPHQP